MDKRVFCEKVYKNTHDSIQMMQYLGIFENVDIVLIEVSNEVSLSRYNSLEKKSFIDVSK